MPSQITPRAYISETKYCRIHHHIVSVIFEAILKNGGHFQSITSISETKRSRAFNVESMHRFCGTQISEKSIAEYIMPLYTPFWRSVKNGGHFKSNTIYLGKYETVNRHSSIYIISFMPNIIRIAHCYVYDKKCGHNLAECCGYLF